MIKKNHLFLAFLVCLSSAVAHADDSSYNVKFTGTIVAETCDVDVSSKNQSINIGTFSTADFPTVGSTTIFKPVDISLKNCTQGISGAKVFFTGTEDSDDPSLLALEDTDGTGQMASGVGVEILDVNQKTVPINNVESDLYTLTKGKNTLAFYLRYKSTQPTIKAGNATAVMYFDLQYQ